MAKATTKTAGKPKATPKVAKASAALTKPPAKPKAAPKPTTETKSKAPAAVKPKAATNLKVKAAKSEKGIVKQTSDAISQLASDILHDRIVPTIEQIKSIAASALSQDETKGKRAKKKKG
jgi:hypothetical protein